MLTGCGARTPEELETLLEDALMIGDHAALAALFEPGSSLAAGSERPARGEEESARRALMLWGEDAPYLAAPQQVLVARDLALVVGELGVNVARRDQGGSWRYAIVWQSTNDDMEKETTMIQQTRQIQPLSPVAVASDAGDARWWFGSLAVIKATAAQTGGLLTMIEITEPPGMAGPLHVHHRDDEAFWILEGEVTFEVGGKTVEARAGDFVFGPRDVPHRYTTGSNGCRMLFIFTPGGFEETLLEMSEPAKRRTLPPPVEVEPDWERIAAIAQAHGCELLG